MHGRSCSTIDLLVPTMPGRSSVGFSPNRQKFIAPSVKRCEVFGVSHEGWAESKEEPLVRRTFLHTDDSVELIGLFSGVATSGGKSTSPRARHLIHFLD